MNRLHTTFKILFKCYGPQGWWPLQSKSGIRGFDETGYHKGVYTYPRTGLQRFEVCVGAILTQNTAWKNVEIAVKELIGNNLLDPLQLVKCPQEEIGSIIKPAGYFNQKAMKLKLFAHAFIGWEGRLPTRDELLALWGIGPETADSILLYAYNQPEFVVDAYTKRIFMHLGLVKEPASYDATKELFEESLDSDPKLFQEYHALLVEHGKRCYQKRPFKDNLLSTSSSR